MLTATAALVAGGIVSSGEAQAVTCYDGATPFTKLDHERNFPPDNRAWITATSRCSDLNIKVTNSGAYVKWCWQTGYAQWDCADTWKWAPKNTWKVLATNVKDGTNMKIQFKDIDGVYKGYLAK
ncbi:hypothetical protein [Streptomyces cyaneus]|uniref:hypothetical protein n=1 Tax=Streptomyces cyaneus TaxID=1904 RepID=UPI000FF89E90|nr:hypothetical protein [Streptomyces cyaneus]